MRLIIATIAAACSIAVLIDTPRRELEEELKQQWQEYREHVGNPAFPASSENLANSFQSRLDTNGNTNDTSDMPNARGGRRYQQGAEKWQRFSSTEST